MTRFGALFGVLLAWGTVSGASPSAAQPAGSIPSVFDEVGIDERLGDRLPLDARFEDETGHPVTLGEYFDGERPVVLNLVYHECPMLCSLLLTEFTRTLSEMEWQPGGEFEVVTVSFSANEDPTIAARAKEKYLAQLGRPEAGVGWHFLTGEDESIQVLADALGFRFRWVESSREFAHPAALIFASGDGMITRYIHGMGYPPADVRKALIEASEGRVGSTVDRILLYCYRYDADANSYVLHARNLMKLGGLMTLLLVVVGLALLWRREHGPLRPAGAA
jgi:protein SCO1/2